MNKFKIFENKKSNNPRNRATATETIITTTEKIIDCLLEGQLTWDNSPFVSAKYVNIDIYFLLIFAYQKTPLGASFIKLLPYYTPKIIKVK